jgi:hypothetical protein
MEKYIIKSDVQFSKSFLNQKYPYFTHEENLDSCFDYYSGLVSCFAKNVKNLKNDILELSTEVKNTFDKYINENKKETENILIYYLMLQTAILILNRHYNNDGTRKY